MDKLPEQKKINSKSFALFLAGLGIATSSFGQIESAKTNAGAMEINNKIINIDQKIPKWIEITEWNFKQLNFDPTLVQEIDSMKPETKPDPSKSAFIFVDKAGNKYYWIDYNKKLPVSYENKKKPTFVEYHKKPDEVKNKKEFDGYDESPYSFVLNIKGVKVYLAKDFGLIPDSVDFHNIYIENSGSKDPDGNCNLVESKYEGQSLIIKLKMYPWRDDHKNFPLQSGEIFEWRLEKMDENKKQRFVKELFNDKVQSVFAKYSCYVDNNKNYIFVATKDEYNKILNLNIKTEDEKVFLVDNFVVVPFKGE